MWYDEIFSLTFIKDHSVISIIIDSFRVDFHPFVYYFLLKLWTILFGQSEVTSRLLSTFIGLTSIIMIYQFSLTLFNNRASATLSALLAAISPVYACFAREARMYMFLILSWTMLLYCMQKLIKTDYAWKWIAGFIFTFFLFSYSHGSSGFITLPFIIPALLFGIGSDLKNNYSYKLMTKVSIISACVLIYLPWLIRLTIIVSSDSSKATLSVLEGFLFMYQLLFLRPGSLLYTSNPIIFFLVLLLLTVTITALYCHARKAGNVYQIVFLSLSYIIPILTVVILSRLKPFYLPRILLFLFVPIVIIIPAGIVEIFKTSIKQTKLFRYFLLLTNFLLILIFIKFLIGVTLNDLTAGHQKDDWRGIVNYANQNISKNDIVLLYPAFTKICFRHYYDNDKDLKIIGIGDKDKDFNKTTRQFFHELSKAERNAKIWVFFSHKRNKEKLHNELINRNLILDGIIKAPGIVLAVYK